MRLYPFFGTGVMLLVWGLFPTAGITQTADDSTRILQLQSIERQNQAKALARSTRMYDTESHFNKGLIPIPDLGKSRYQGIQGGLYPGGENTHPLLKEGIARAKKIHPRATDGDIDLVNGKIVWLSIGMSNTTQETRIFLKLMRFFKEKNTYLSMIDGAFGAQEINKINNASSPYWDHVMQRLGQAGLSAQQVQVIWFKEAEAAPKDTSFANYPLALKEKYLNVMLILKQKFPNIRLVYLSPRAYAGFAKTDLNPEPFAWYTGWAIKYLIEDQIKGDPRTRFNDDNPPMPFLTWGPYLWANGNQPNAQGMSYTEEDFGPDGTHPSPTGQEKIAYRLLEFFSKDELGKYWFRP